MTKQAAQTLEQTQTEIQQKKPPDTSSHEFVENDEIKVELIFPTYLYVIEKPSLMPALREVASEYLAKREKEQGELHELYPVRMGDDMQFDPRMQEFCGYVGRTGFDILREQGVDLQGRACYFTELWVQEHHKHSLMEQHVHGAGAQLGGFYFIDAPEHGSVASFYDPRAGKVASMVHEADNSNVSYASNTIHFMPRPGVLMFANAWLPHAFTRHGANTPFRFIHFNIHLTEATAETQCNIKHDHDHDHGQQPAPPPAPTEVEIV